MIPNEYEITLKSFLKGPIKGNNFINLIEIIEFDILNWSALLHGEVILSDSAWFCVEKLKKHSFETKKHDN